LQEGVIRAAVTHTAMKLSPVTSTPFPYPTVIRLTCSLGPFKGVRYLLNDTEQYVSLSKQRKVK